MEGSKLKIDIRRSKIMDQLRLNGKVSVAQLADELKTTSVTIRNDLSALEREGYLTRVQGGAVRSNRMQRGFSVAGADKNVLQKQALAQEVSRIVSDGETLFINSGTTTYHVALALKEKKYLNIVTNSLVIAMELGNIPTFNVLLLGGEMNATYGFTYGGDAQDQLCRYQADWAILSVDSVSAKGGVTTYHPEEAIIDRLMMTNARRQLVVATGEKIGKMGFSRICDCDARTHLITDSSCDKEALQELKERGVRATKV